MAQWKIRWERKRKNAKEKVCGFFFFIYFPLSNHFPQKKNFFSINRFYFYLLFSVVRVIESNGQKANEMRRRSVNEGEKLKKNNGNHQWNGFCSMSKKKKRRMRNKFYGKLSNLMTSPMKLIVCLLVDNNNELKLNGIIQFILIHSVVRVKQSAMLFSFVRFADVYIF